jgi:hypothetical protein
MTTSNTSNPPNKYRTAMEVLQRGRDQMVEEMAEQVIDQAEEFLSGGYLFTEFLEGQGTKLHFLSVLLAQLEQSAEQQEEAEAQAAAESPTTSTSRKRKPRAKKLTGQTSRESEPDEM